MRWNDHYSSSFITIHLCSSKKITHRNLKKTGAALYHDGSFIFCSYAARPSRLKRINAGSAHVLTRSPQHSARVHPHITLTVTVFYPPRLRLLFQVQFTVKNKVTVFFTHHQTVKIFWFEFPVFHMAGNKAKTMIMCKNNGIFTVPLLCFFIWLRFLFW